jgi:thioredoxin reductase
LFHVQHVTVTAGAERVHLGLPDMLAHNVPYFEKCDGESQV